MVYRVTLVAAIVLVFSASLLAHKRLDEPMRPEVAPFWQCRRIVSMAPSITETLYALGLGRPRGRGDPLLRVSARGQG